MNELLISSSEFTPLARELLLGGCMIRFSARGVSMRPFILDGDVLTIVPARICDIRVGDVVLHEQKGGAIVAHRVVAVETHIGETFIRTRGDGRSGDTDKVEAGSVLGKAVKAERGTQVLVLDCGIHRFLAILWLAFSPLSQFLLRVVHRAGMLR